jgi:ATP-binding cassette, subfamily B, bacterial PglK
MNFFNNFILIKEILDNKDKSHFLILVFFTLIGLLLELIGIAMIIPVISVTVSSEELDFFSKKKLIEISEFLGFSTSINFLLVTLLLIFFLKMIFFVGLSFFQKKYVSQLIKKISNNLFINYINQDVAFYNKKNKSVIIQNLQTETYYLFLYFESLLLLITDTLLVILFILFFAIYNIEGFFLLFSYFGIAFLIYLLLTKSKSFIWGKKRLELDDIISKIVLETFGFIKQIILNESKVFFINNFIKKNNQKYKYISYRLTLDQIPKIYFEFVTIVFIVLYTYLLYNGNESTNSIITKLGILVAISYKIIPSLSKISASFQTIKNTSSSLEKIYDEIKNENPTKIKFLRFFDKKIQFKNLNFSHSKSQKALIENLNLTIKKNEVLGFFGESGIGKTTILDIISGLHTNYKGDLFIDSKLINRNLKRWKPNVSYVSQDTFIFNDTIENNIIISKAGNSLDEIKFNRAIKKSQIKSWIDTLDKKEKTIISHEGSNISGGQKQRIGIARAIYKDSDLLIFDEPTSALDNKTEAEIINTIYKLRGEKTIIIVSHNRSALSRCDQIVELK